MRRATERTWDRARNASDHAAPRFAPRRTRTPSPVLGRLQPPEDLPTCLQCAPRVLDRPGDPRLTGAHPRPLAVSLRPDGSSGTARTQAAARVPTGAISVDP